jgi:hypothetical protein
MRSKKACPAYFLLVLAASCGLPATAQTVFKDSFPSGVTRTWIGPDYWANRLQDWRVKDGRLECVVPQSGRNVGILTWRAKGGSGDLTVRYKVGLLNTGLPQDGRNMVGFRLGSKSGSEDYRADAIRGHGFAAGIMGDGKLFIGKPDGGASANQKVAQLLLKGGVVLKYDLDVKKQATLKLSAIDPATGKTIDSVEKSGLDARAFRGGIGFLCSGARRGKNWSGAWFDDLAISGTKLEHLPERAWGPVLFLQYTLSRKILTMNVQMAPIGEQDGKMAVLQAKRGGQWKTVAESAIDPDARTATFRVKNWDDAVDTPYRVVYDYAALGGKKKRTEYGGTIRKNPVKKEKFVLGAFTGNKDTGYPHSSIFEMVEKLNPDMLFFSGDQIYETVAGYGCQIKPVEPAMLDYLRKWYIYGWAFGELFRDRPVVSIPDDHDVYHGNIWGCAGKAAPYGKGAKNQDAGGYLMPPRFVKMVERTQTANLPPPFDPTPVKQGIGVYYTSINYGGISFAVTEDRKFKSAPKALLPEAKIFNGWYQNPDWDPVTQGDAPGAVLLGERQLKFLDAWAADWSHGAKMKVLLSATVLETCATLPASAKTDDVVPHLKNYNSDEYPPDDKPAADMDSNGWPQTGRAKAVELLRKCFAFHVAGDQHLASFTKYGLNDWRDSSYAFCVPSIANAWPRRWFPAQPGKNHKPGTPRYTGDFLDGFGNKLTVYAIGNPDRNPQHAKAAGFGMVEFNKTTREIVTHCLRRNPPNKEFPGWPITVSQFENYGGKVLGWLPTVVSNVADPVVKVYRQDTKELVYAVRIKGKSFAPPVYADARYVVEIGLPDRGEVKKFESVKPASQKDAGKLDVKF